MQHPFVHLPLHSLLSLPYFIGYGEGEKLS